MINRMNRRGLAESLEDYAKRLNTTPDMVRPIWRAEALRLLLGLAKNAALDAVTFNGLRCRGMCAIAPGVSVPTAHVEWSGE